MTMLPVSLRSVCFFWAGIQEVDQCGAAEHVVGHLRSLHIETCRRGWSNLVMNGTRGNRLKCSRLDTPSYQ